VGTENPFGDPMVHSPRILIVSDDAQFEFMRAAVEARGFEVTVAHDHESAQRRLLESRFDLVVIDVAEGARDIPFIQRLRATPKLSKIFVLALGEWGTGQPTLALSQGADAYEPKPVTPERLIASVERMLRRHLTVAE
jgi:DNA-binding response OmpR family regulator